MDFTVIINRLNQLTAFINLMITNSKKIFELPEETTGDKLIATYNTTSNETEQMNLTDLLSLIYESSNRMLTYGSKSNADNLFTFGVGYTWIYNGINYANTDEIEIIIDDADDGFYRSDIIVADTNNQLIKVIGFESNTFSVPPEVPPGTLLVYTINVFGDEIETPIEPITGFIEKETHSAQSYNGSGILDSLAVNSKQSVIQFIGTTSEFRSIQKNVDNWFDGQIAVFDNRQSLTDISIKHLTGTGNVLFWFPSLSDFILKKGFKIILRFNKELMRLEYIGDIFIDINTSITITSDSTVALNVVEKEAYYGIQTSGALLSLPAVVGFESKKFIISNLSLGTINLYSNNGTDLDILNNGTSINQLSIPNGNVVTLFNDGLKWVIESAGVSGTTNQIVVTNGNITPTIGISPAYTTAINDYADSKVQDSISDGTIDKAPSQNAVFDALALKEDKTDYLESNGFDFIFDTFGTAVFSGGNIATGTLENSVINSTPISRYNGVAWVHRGNATNANSGYRTYITANRYLFVGAILYLVIRPSRLTNTYIRAGLQSSEAFTIGVDALNMCCVEIINNQITFKTSIGTATTSAPTTLTNTDWLYILIEVESSTQIRCRVKNVFGGADLMNVVSNTNLPISAENSGVSGYQERFLWASVGPTATTDPISQISRISHFQKKPKFLNSY